MKEKELNVIFVNEGGQITEILVSDPSIKVTEVEFYSDYDDYVDFEGIMCKISDSKMHSVNWGTVRTLKDFDEEVNL